MTLTVKESPDLDSLGKPGSSSPGSEEKSSSAPRRNPVCLEVPVTIRSLPAQNGDTSGSAAPIREEGRTVIVFDNGAVLRLASNLPSGQTVILSNPRGRDVVCRIANTRNLPTVKGYVEVEFVEPVDDFWRIHQTGEPTSVSNAHPSVSAPSKLIPSEPPTPSQEPIRVAAPIIPPAEEQNHQPGHAPTFEDIAGLVSMSPAATAGDSVFNGSTEFKHRPVDAPRFASPVNLATPVSGAPVSVPARNLPPPNVLSDRGMLSSAQTSSVFTSSESRGRMPLILGAAAAIVLGLGAGFFFMHKGSAASPVSSSGAVTEQPEATRPAASNAVEPVQPAQSVADQAPRPAPVSGRVSTDGTGESTPSALEAARSTVNAPDALQPERAATRRQKAPNLKMSSPVAPNKNLARGPDEIPSSIPSSIIDAAPAVSAGSALPAVMRTENQPAPPPPGPGGPISSGKTSREATLISSVRPIYSSVARQSNAQGRVVVSAEVDASGKVIGAKAVTGPMLLRQAAIDAVRQWQYEPALVNGKPSASQVIVNIDFSLK